MEHVAVGDAPGFGLAPEDVVNALDSLQVHRQPLEPIGDLARHGAAVEAAHLLEVSELRDLHAVQPHLPPEAPGSERRRLPVVLDQAHVVNERIEPERGETSEVEIEDRKRRGFDHDLVLVVVLKAKGVLAVAAVGRPAGRLHVRGAPGLRSHRAQERRRVKGAGPDFHVVGLEDHAALIRPVPLQREDQLLEGARRAADFHGRWPFLAPKERASIRRGGAARRGRGSHDAPKEGARAPFWAANHRLQLPGAHKWCNNRRLAHQECAKRLRSVSK